MQRPRLKGGAPDARAFALTLLGPPARPCTDLSGRQPYCVMAKRRARVKVRMIMATRMESCLVHPIGATTTRQMTILTARLLRRQSETETWIKRRALARLCPVRAGSNHAWAFCAPPESCSVERFCLGSITPKLSARDLPLTSTSRFRVRSKCDWPSPVIT